ncbi:chemotaxis protein CheW [Lacticigenium naphthae]|uniref:chemotaxis protein CheW n=1 Tax=Lacticigenium naphthae TaxID=515351 RepID=UPI0003F5A17C|nr:chemotaxis protein CheW [Lacticigenium naphthae]
MEKQIVFKIGGQQFSVPITDTEKIIHLSNLSKLPDVSNYILGVMEAGGVLLPIIHLPKRFFNQELLDPDAPIIVVHWKGKLIGLAVDEVLSVKDFESEQVKEKAESRQIVVQQIYFSSFIQTEAGIIPVLNVNALFAGEKEAELKELLSIDTVNELVRVNE